MATDFDRLIDLRPTDSLKWHAYGDDVLPLWVADMDFQSPGPVIRALREHVDRGIFGYGQEPPALRGVITDWIMDRYGWPIQPDWLVFVPGVVTGFNLACHAFTAPGDGVLFQTPVYSPILDAPANAGLEPGPMELTCGPDGHYGIDFGRMESAISARTRIFILCNPHNPVGRVFRPAELERMAEICLRHDLVICSDEIHSDLVLDDHRHIPIASLAPEIAVRTVSLMAPSKTFNVAGLQCSVGVIPDAALRERYQAARAGLVPYVNLMGYAAALAAYRDGRPWLDELLRYLAGNREFLLGFVRTRLPGIRMSRPEGTYLAWLDCRQAGIPGSPADFFLRQARVALNDGAQFGPGGAGFVRLNFGCPQSRLAEALTRMESALAARG